MKTTLAACAAALSLLAGGANALTINPSSDGSLYTCAGCKTVSEGAYVTSSGDIQGAVKSSSAAIDGPVSQALLSLNPYGLPLWGATIDLYGDGTEIGVLTAADANAGSFIGSFALPKLTYGQDAFFDVTSFVAATQASFLAFNIRSQGTDLFSSLEYNDGHPAQLLVTSLPEPGTVAMMLAGLLITAATIRRQAHPMR